MNQFKNLDINIYNYSIKEMVLLFKLTDNYNKNNVNEQKKALINEINRAEISNEKKLKVIDFIKQVAYFLQVNLSNKTKIKNLNKIVTQQKAISKKLTLLNDKLIKDC